MHFPRLSSSSSSRSASPPNPEAKRKLSGATADSASTGSFSIQIKLDINEAIARYERCLDVARSIYTTLKSKNTSIRIGIGFGKAYRNTTADAPIFEPIRQLHVALVDTHNILQYLYLPEQAFLANGVLATEAALKATTQVMGPNGEINMNEGTEMRICLSLIEAAEKVKAVEAEIERELVRRHISKQAMGVPTTETIRQANSTSGTSVWKGLGVRRRRWTARQGCQSLSDVVPAWLKDVPTPEGLNKLSRATALSDSPNWPHGVPAGRYYL
jgi:hypothetical protein